jgi:putative ABC transport system ATP-binding protein
MPKLSEVPSLKINNLMNLLEIKNLKKSYISPDREHQLVVDVQSFILHAKEQKVLKGMSGSGKTTFLHLISGILKADSGSIILADQEVTNMTESCRDWFRAQHVGYIYQTFNLLQGYTAFENVLMGMIFGQRPDPQRIKMLLKRVGLGNRMDYLPGQLSVGQQQRVAVARALANHPRLVLADEPTGNLDPHHAMETIKLIKDVSREFDASLLIVTHDKEIMDCFESVEDFHQLNKALV